PDEQRGDRHCERSEAIQKAAPSGLLRRFAPRNDKADIELGSGVVELKSLEEATMADDAARNSRLGRGLASLMGDVGVESQTTERATRNQRKVPIEFVRAN